MQCCNPLLSYADSPKTYDALKKLDFSVVSDIFMTPTAFLADIVLPAATHFEFNDIGHYGLGHGYILARPKIVDPPEECWPDVKILNELGKCMTSHEVWYDDHQDLLEEVLKPSGLDYPQFVERGYLKGPEKFRKYIDKGFKTPTGKVELLLSQADKMNLSALPRYDGPPEEEDPDYPLVLFCSKSRYSLPSSYRWVERLRKREPTPEADIQPETAARYRISQGDELVIETKRGAVTQVAHVTDAVSPDVVHAAYGWWLSEGKSKAGIDWQTSNYNMVTSIDRIGKEFGTPNLKGMGCRIRRK
jgi:anaerobic selenocysteine-containing dehydrogenase